MLGLSAVEAAELLWLMSMLILHPVVCLVQAASGSRFLAPVQPNPLDIAKAQDMSAAAQLKQVDAQTQAARAQNEADANATAQFNAQLSAYDAATQRAGYVLERTSSLTAFAFSPDGQFLFLTVGDRQRFTPAQDPDQPVGKILRLTLDGKPAPAGFNPRDLPPGAVKRMEMFREGDRTIMDLKTN